MAIISITIPDTVATRVVNALCSTYGYQAIITNPDGTTNTNPITQGQFAKQQVIQFIKNTVSTSESNLAASKASQAAITSVDTDITLS